MRVPVGLHARFLSAAELLQLPKQPDLCVSEGFLARALPKGDRCFALLESGRIASLGWYSRFPTRINEELAFSFDPACVYMYAGYTLPEYRGKRLHATGMALALAAYTAEGSKGIVSYVESWNVASLRSCERMGYKEIRRLRMTKLGSHYWIQNSRQCESLQVKLARVEKPPA